MSVNFEAKILHIGVRIMDINPVHTRLAIFTGAAPKDNDVPLERLTRGKSGELVVDTSTLKDFLKRLNPVHASWPLDINEKIPVELFDFMD